MCGHFTIGAITLKQIIERYDLPAQTELDFGDKSVAAGFFPSRKQATTLVPVIVCKDGARMLDIVRWDLVPSWWSKPLTEKKYSSFNARSDSLREKATFKGAWNKGQRCLIPATMFFEWPDKDLMPRDQKRTEQKINLTDQKLFSMAGLWDECRVGENKGMRSCAIITVAGNKLMTEIPHTRMPAIIAAGSENAWLDQATAPDAAFEMLQKYPAENMVIAQ